MREIVLDTETTGLNPLNGDRIVEIGAVELINHVPTGKEYHQYINPMRSMSEEVIQIHGLTEEFLSDKPTFDEIYKDFLDFIGDDSVLVIHNAPFDMKFINCHLEELKEKPIGNERVIDTLVIARKKFPGSRVNLDDLCRRFGVDNSSRTVHGALLDAQLLADVYLELLGGHEPGFSLKQNDTKKIVKEDIESVSKTFHEARHFAISEEEDANHKAFLDKIKEPLWNKNEEE